MKKRNWIWMALAVMGCDQPMPGWVNMSADVVEGDETGDAAPVALFGTPPAEPVEEEEETTDTGLAAPVVTTGATALYVENRSKEAVCYLHLHACDERDQLMTVCGQVEPGKTTLTDVVDVLGSAVLEGNDNAELWLEDECVALFAVDCAEARCWAPDPIDLTAGTQTVLLKN